MDVFLEEFLESVIVYNVCIFVHSIFIRFFEMHGKITQNEGKAKTNLKRDFDVVLRNLSSRQHFQFIHRLLLREIVTGHWCPRLERHRLYQRFAPSWQTFAHLLPPCSVRWSARCRSRPWEVLPPTRDELVRR
mmetsp:Transcript_4111/g.10684  ORF Transcript_4111/g.10684 Transcript_4111/m.10684 type:complete len:133 (+) Transcript_4111:359-757(+)